MSEAVARATLGVILGGVMLLAWPGCGHAASQEILSQAAPPRMVPLPPETPRWTLRPSPLDLERAYPVAALRNGVSGWVLLACFVDPEGGMSGCKIEQETPAGLGFGPAALGLVQAFGADPEKVPPGTLVRVPIQFMMAE
jgi:TonB family protein